MSCDALHLHDVEEGLQAELSEPGDYPPPRPLARLGHWSFMATTTTTCRVTP
jgi:hypothetical protein